MRAAERGAFAMAVVETREKEKKMLAFDTFERLLAESSPQKAEAALIAGGYAGVVPGLLSASNFDGLLRRAEESFAAQMLAISPDPKILDLFFLEYDLFNIKALLMKNDEDVAFNGDPVAYSAGEPSRTARFEQWFQSAQALYMEKGAKAMQETVDRQYFEKLLQLAHASGVPLCVDYALARVDFYNLLCLLRINRIAAARGIALDGAQADALYDRVWIPGGRVPLETLKDLKGAAVGPLMLLMDGTVYRDYLVEGFRGYSYGNQLYPLEKKMDDYLTELMRKGRGIALGPEPLLGYLHGRRMETLNFRLVLTGLYLKVSKPVIAERLRETYA